MDEITKDENYNFSVRWLFFCLVHWTKRKKKPNTVCTGLLQCLSPTGFISLMFILALEIHLKPSNGLGGSQKGFWSDTFLPDHAWSTLPLWSIPVLFTCSNPHLKALWGYPGASRKDMCFKTFLTRGLQMYWIYCLAAFTLKMILEYM